MEYKLTKEDLGNDALYNTLTALQATFTEIGQPLYIVGACARDMAMKVLGLDASSRRTLDLDVAIMLKDWDAFDELVHRLQINGFERYQKTQKFFYKGLSDEYEYEVDIVPFGEIAENEVIKWPPDGNPELSVRCFVDIMSHAIDICIDNVKVKIAPIAGQFLTKLDAWNERHLKTDKDASDMFVILYRYYDYILELKPERFADVDTNILTDSSSLLDVSAHFLASDAAMLLSRNNIEFFVDLIAKELSKEESSDLIYHFMKRISCDEQLKYDQARNIWIVIHSTLQKELKD